MMKSRPRTIQIYLPSGDPRGLRVAELTTSIVRVIEVPRALLEQFYVMPEAKQVGLYLLVGDSDGAGRPAAYIGQTGALAACRTWHIAMCNNRAEPSNGTACYRKMAQKVMLTRCA